MRRGVQVRLPNCRTGIVVDSHDGEVDVFTGRRRDLSPVIDTYVECELALTGATFPQIAALVVAELREPKSQGNWPATVVTGS